MATYNTAFGSLPSPKTLTGSSGTFSTDEDEERPRNRLQQFGAQQQSQAQQPAPTQTFAQMQAAGQARPAPAMAQPQAQPQAAPTLAQQTAQTLGVAGPAPAPAPQPSMVQTLQSQFQQPIAAPAPAPEPAPAVAVAPASLPEPTPMPAQDVGGGVTTRTAPEQEKIDHAEEREWVKTNAAQLPFGRIPDGYVYVPASQGGPAVRRLSYAESVARGYEPYGGEALFNDPNNQYGLFLWQGKATRDFLTKFGAGMKKPETYDAWIASRSSAPIGPDPFANRGNGLPTPPAPAGGGDMLSRLNQMMGAGAGGAGVTGTGATQAPAQFALSPEARAMQTRLASILRQMESAPSPYESEAYKAQLAASEAELESQYKTERQRLDEELARRGLSASTFGSDRMQSLAGAQARAQASMRADLLKEAANQQAQRQEVLLRAMGDLSGQMGTQEIAAYNANLERYRTSGQFELDARRLQQDYALRGMDLTLQQARDLVDKDFKNKSLELQLKELLSRETLTREELAVRERMGLAQSRNSIIASLLGNFDFSAFTPEQINEILRGAGIGITVPPKPAPDNNNNSGNTGGKGSTPSGGTGTPITVTTPPTDLSPYPEGQQFLYNGQLLVKRNGILVDALTGRPFDTRE